MELARIPCISKEQGPKAPQQANKFQSSGWSIGSPLPGRWKGTLSRDTVPVPRSIKHEWEVLLDTVLVKIDHHHTFLTVIDGIEIDPIRKLIPPGIQNLNPKGSGRAYQCTCQLDFIPAWAISARQPGHLDLTDRHTAQFSPPLPPGDQKQGCQQYQKPARLPLSRSNFAQHARNPACKPENRSGRRTVGEMTGS